MGRKLIPVIATDVRTGEEIRYPSYVAAAADLGGKANRVARACLNDQPYIGHLFRREDNWVLKRGARR